MANDLTIHAKPKFNKTSLDYTVVHNDDDVVEYLCRHVTKGGGVSDFCEVFKVDYFSLMRVIKDNKIYRDNFALAKTARKDYIKEKVTSELMNIVSSKVTDAYDKFGNLKDLDDMDDDTKKLISSIETSIDKDECTIQKLKFQDKTKALDMLSKQQGMYVQKVEVSANVTLESLLTKSFDGSQ